MRAHLSISANVRVLPIADIDTVTKRAAMQWRLGPLAVATATAVLASVLASSCVSKPDVDGRAGVPLTTRLVVDKREHRMRAYHGTTLLREFKVALGRGGLGPKVQQGDGRVPEGKYAIDTRNRNSAFHLSSD